MKDISLIIHIKQDVQLVYKAYLHKYKKIPRGIQELYYDIMLNNDLRLVKKSYAKFYGYITKSINAKERYK